MSNVKRAVVARRAIDARRAVVAVKWTLLSLGAMALGGCGGEQLNSLLSVPTPMPTPATPKKPTKPVFSAADYLTPGDKRPGTYRVTAVLSGELITIQGVPAATPTPTPAGAPARPTPATGAPASAAAAAAAAATPAPIVPQLGVPETVHLAGIIAPAPNQPGWEGAVRTALNWTALNPKDQTVEVEDDPRYPRDAQGRAMVQIYFKSTSDGATRYNLNRMMIRSGYAVVDLYSATTIDVQKWLNDEQYARTSRLGLWKLGITLAQRIPPPMSGVAATAGATSVATSAQNKGGKGASRARTPKGSAPILRATPATAPSMTAPTASPTTTATGTPAPSGANSGVPAPSATPR